jgi:V/A-type H+-transporting ATPase subunit G/H
MTKEILEDIRKAEIKADEIIKQAGQEAKKIVSTAADEAFKIRERAVADSEKTYHEKKEKLAAEALKEVEKIIDQTKGKIKEMTGKAGGHVDQAVDFVTERILDTDGYN